MTDRPYTDLAVAAVSCALDPKTVTPARIVEYGPWWVAAYQAGRQSTPTVGPGAEPRCDVEGHEHELARACRCCAADRKVGLWTTPTTSSGTFDAAKRSGDVLKGVRRAD